MSGIITPPRIVEPAEPAPATRSSPPVSITGLELLAGALRDFAHAAIAVDPTGRLAGAARQLGETAELVHAVARGARKPEELLAALARRDEDGQG